MEVRQLGIFNRAMCSMFICAGLTVQSAWAEELPAERTDVCINENVIGVGPQCGLNCCVSDYDPGPLPSPLSLADAEIFALRNNRSLRSQRNTVQAAAWNQYNARSKWAPKATISLESKHVETVRGSGSETHEQKIAVEQQVYNTDTYYGVCTADLDARASEIDLLDSTNKLLFDVRDAYYTLVVTRQELEVQQENVLILADGLETEERKYEVGETTKFEVRQSKVSVANALSDYYQAVRRHKVAYDALLALLGLEPDDGVEIELASNDIPVMSVNFIRSKAQSLGWDPEGDDDEKDDFLRNTFRVYSTDVDLHDEEHIFTDYELWLWQERAREHRPDLKKRCVAVQKAHNNVNIKLGEWHPKVSAFASGKNNTTGRFEIANSKSSWETGARLSWTLFDGMGRRFRIKEAQAKRCSEQVAYDRAWQDAQIQVERRFHELEEAFLSYFAASQSVRLAEEAIELASNRRDLGVITPLEFRDTASSLTQARLTLSRASFNLLTSYYALRREAGVDVADNICLLLNCCEAADV